MLILNGKDLDIVVLGLAILSLDRPGWEDAIRDIARGCYGEDAVTRFEEYRRMNADRFKGLPPAPLGPTGEFPRGRLHASDEGELRLGVTVRQGTVVVAFGGPVTWIGLPPAQARQLAAALTTRADEAARVS